jgi:hypothetical protein
MSSVLIGRTRAAEREFFANYFAPQKRLPFLAKLSDAMSRVLKRQKPTLERLLPPSDPGTDFGGESG